MLQDHEIARLEELLAGLGDEETSDVIRYYVRHAQEPDLIFSDHDRWQAAMRECNRLLD